MTRLKIKTRTRLIIIAAAFAAGVVFYFLAPFQFFHEGGHYIAALLVGKTPHFIGLDGVVVEEFSSLLPRELKFIAMAGVTAEAILYPLVAIVLIALRRPAVGMFFFGQLHGSWRCAIRSGLLTEQMDNAMRWSALADYKLAMWIAVPLMWVLMVYLFVRFIKKKSPVVELKEATT